MLGRIKNFFIESRQELKQVRWPTRKEAIYLTSVVIALSAFLAVFLGAFDLLFAEGLRMLITR
jgi:preprotein translocase SecE subunit